MFKLACYLDFDGTIVDSCDAMAAWYNYTYQFYKDFKPAIGKDIYKWDGKDQLTLSQEGDIVKIFNSDFFFEHVKPNKDAHDVLKRMHESSKFELIVCSIGTAENISKKVLYLKENFPFIKQHIMLVQDYSSDLKMNKSILRGKAILLDDHVDNLYTSKVEFPVLYKNNGDREWNIGWDGRRATSWLDFEDTANYIWDLANLSN